jgi:hypothetical protein
MLRLRKVAYYSRPAELPAAAGAAAVAMAASGLWAALLGAGGQIRGCLHHHLRRYTVPAVSLAAVYTASFMPF